MKYPRVKASERSDEWHRIRKAHTDICGKGRHCMPYFVVDHQSFPICVEYTDKKRAEWFCDNLTSAIERLIAKQK